jgi:hypothetical protein
LAWSRRHPHDRLAPVCSDCRATILCLPHWHSHSHQVCARYRVDLVPRSGGSPGPSTVQRFEVVPVSSDLATTVKPRQPRWMGLGLAPSRSVLLKAHSVSIRRRDSASPGRHHDRS